jgi:hypothetical protein
VRPWLDLWKRLIPDGKLRKCYLDWMAFAVQHPGIKINHHPLIAGAHGCGKDTAFEPFFYGIGGGLPGSRGEPVKDRVNISYVSNDGLDKGWGYHLRAQVCCVQELREVYSGARRKLSNTLKPLLATPPHTLTINEKYAHPFEIPNVINWVFFSNAADAISLDDTERRFLVHWTNAEKLTDDEAGAIWQWYRKGGLKLCARWLHDRDVTQFNPRAAARRTTFHDTLSSSGKTDIESALQTLIDERQAPFEHDLVSPDKAANTISSLVLNGKDPGGLRKTVTAQQISTALTAKQWVRLPRIDTTRGKKRLTATLFAHSDVPTICRVAKPASVYDAYTGEMTIAKLVKETRASIKKEKQS